MCTHSNDQWILLFMFASKHLRTISKNIPLIINTPSGELKALSLGTEFEYEKTSKKWKTLVSVRGYIKEVYIEDIVYIGDDLASDLKWISRYLRSKFF